MHKVEIRLTNEGNEDAANVFEVYNEALGDKGYTEVAKQEVAGNGAPIVMFLELNERVIVVAKGNSGRLVYDKAQNANIRVETDEEKAYRADREKRTAEREADLRVEAARGKVQNAQEAAAQTERDAQREVRQAEAVRDKTQDAGRVPADKVPGVNTEPGNQTHSAPTPSVRPTPQTQPTNLAAPGPQGLQRSVHPSNPASANTGPRDSKPVKT